MVLTAAVAGVLMLRQGGDPGQGGSIAVARIEPAPAAPIRPAEPVAAAAPAPETMPGTPGILVQPNGDTVEYQNGVKIIRLNPRAASNSVSVPVTDDPAARLPVAAGSDTRLLEASPFGDLPRIGPSGLRSSEAYARPPGASLSVQPGAARLALLIGGLGRDKAVTARTAKRLPAAVSLGFLPDGMALQAQVAGARGAGHEVLLQLAAAVEDGSTPLDRLHRMMGRFSGYVGIAGDRAAVPRAAAASLLVDLAARGLLFVDDSASPTDDLRALAGPLGLPFAQAAVVADATTGGDAVTAALERLRDRAKAEGSAVGYVDGGGNALDAVSRFIEGLDRQGVTLVPVSALAGTGPVRSSTANAP